ncbi:MAG: nuclear transport factor 2 family protein [Pseudonocardiales bacterium]|nr:nuclear transport factor 2 family protein [Pseudonocardiales bacterium]
MSSITSSINDGSIDVLYHQIQQFYAHQMQLLDEGRVEEWAASFTEDGVFAANAYPEPTRGRTAIYQAAQEITNDLSAKGITRRHWLGMLALDPRDDGSVFVRSYAQVLETPRGGATVLRIITVCEDLLCHDGKQWLVRNRQVWRDGLR